MCNFLCFSFFLCPNSRIQICHLLLSHDTQVMVDNGRSERITVIDNTHTLSAQHAVTEYQVVTSSSSGEFLSIV